MERDRSVDNTGSRARRTSCGEFTSEPYPPGNTGPNSEVDFDEVGAKNVENGWDNALVILVGDWISSVMSLERLLRFWGDGDLDMEVTLDYECGFIGDKEMKQVEDG